MTNIKFPEKVSQKFASCQCTDYARVSCMYIAGAGEARVARVAFAVREAVCSIFLWIAYNVELITLLCPQ